MTETDKDSLYLDLKDSLENKLSGEVRFDQISKTLYSTDASNYQIEPVGIVIPKNVEDVSKTLEIASGCGVAILPRGSGSSLAGQAVGHALIIDLSKYLNQILEVNTEEKTVRVQSGMFLEQLNRALQKHGLMFGPDPSSAKIATIGGVVGNNATGAHSILYGMAGDNVDACKLFLNKGESLELRESATENTASNELLRNLSKLKEKYTDLIENDFPRHWRRASGYSLNYFLEKPFNPAKLLAGAEGTLGLATEFTLKLVPRWAFTGLAILQFDTMVSAMETVPTILETNPSAVELIDKYLIDLTRANPSFSRMLTFVEGDPKAILVVEFYGETQSEAEKKVRNLTSFLNIRNINCACSYALSLEAQANVWGVRRAGLGLLMSKRGEFKPIPCIEDTSVPVDQLPSYVADIANLIKRLGTNAGFYGHASAGCLHIRPLVNLKSQRGITIMNELTEETFKLALKYGGVMSGEHGDGLQRSYLNEQLFGKELYGAMKELKTAFDPEGLFNPGKVVDAPSPEKNLRFGESYRPETVETFLDWSSDNGFTGAVEMCSGQGVCRKLGEGIMCPSYMATKNEMDTTRARANILRAIVSGTLPPDAINSQGMYDVFDLCLSCKACKSECPSSVDAAKMKLEFLAHYHSKYGFSIRDRLFGYVYDMSRYTSAISSISNFAINNSFSKQILSKIGIHTKRSLPRLSNEDFISWFNNLPQTLEKKPENKVVYFHDTWATYYHPEIGKAAVQLLKAAGLDVIIVANRVCCGRPMLSKGMIEPARERALKNVSLLAPYVREGIAVVGTEPSCILTFRDEYLDLLPQNEDARILSKNSYVLDEFLLKLNKSSELKINWKQGGPDVFYHGHCHQRSLIGNTSALQMLSLSGCNVTESGAGCCGMAGSFGYESEHYEVSRAIAEDRLLPAIRKMSSDTVIAVSGVSCRDQIEHFSDKKAKHIAQVLAEQIG
ncbi:MAG: FAD-binding protein [Deltaproteobacteria bacterium]|nr:FAD-binding protein [Deltaproteobacteria bacterium]